ncbi:MAG: L,D-transpeptidase [Christensenellales bacterium]|jgi:lipoprotein-anchoring transpeptidase ErfK/SrfK
MAKTASRGARRLAKKRMRQRNLVLIAAGAALLLCVALLLPRALQKDEALSIPPSATEEPPVALQERSPLPTVEPTAEPTPEPTPTPEPAPTPAPKPVVLKYPYCIVVDRGMQVVTVYTVGETGKYDIVVRQMICSTDKYNKKPTNGVYKLDGQHKRWLKTLVDTYAQYATRISGTILFHSLPYKKKSASSLNAKEYLRLGKKASEGCVRLTCEDAKWIYENVPKGTLVLFRKGEYDEKLIEQLAPPPLAGGKWDPTDDNADNPDYIGGSYRKVPDATAFPGVTPAPTKHKIRKWRSSGG